MRNEKTTEMLSISRPTLSTANYAFALVNLNLFVFTFSGRQGLLAYGRTYRCAHMSVFPAELPEGRYFLSSTKQTVDPLFVASNERPAALRAVHYSLSFPLLARSTSLLRERRQLFPIR